MADLYQVPKPVVLLIMDGVGVAPESPGNAVLLSKTPNLDELWPNFPHCYLHASSLHVGLPIGADGNSEVGHMNIGAGKVIYQELPRINNAIDSGAFFNNPLLIDAFKKSNTNRVHIMGLFGNGSVHSSYGHFIALLEMAQKMNINKDNVFLHIFTDGRDSPPKGAEKLISRVEVELKRTGVGRIATIIGRFNAMDRDERWDRTKKAYDMLTKGTGTAVANWHEAINNSYNNNITDEFIEPHVIHNNNKPLTQIQQGDAVIFFNFRADRAIQLTKAFEDTDFKGWERPLIENLTFVGMSDYEQGFPKLKAFPPERITEPIGKIISDKGLKQLRIAESEKYPHVTYFMNGGNQIQFPGEDRIEIPSPSDVATYDQKPEMSAEEITTTVIKKINENLYDLIIINYANPDMVSHTGIIEATIQAIEKVDQCIGRVKEAVFEKGGALLITADHGNAEEMIDLQTGNVDTKHSTNPVPLLIAKKDLPQRELPIGILADIAPTLLFLLNIAKPPEMTGRNLLA